MLDYIIQVLLFQTLFLAMYDLFLKKETFFQWNRAYLLVSSIVAYCIPMIRMDSIQSIVPQEYVIQLPEIMLSPTAIIKEKFDWSSLFFEALQWIFWIGVLLMTILFIIKLINLTRLIHKNEKISKNKYQLVFLESNKAFSFFKYIFLKKDLDGQYKEQIIEHELVHIKQKHTLDLLLFELQKIVCWFNPFSYLFQRRIAELHEFIADAKTVKEVHKKDYFQNLLSQTFGTHKISFINSFFKISLIKKRIIMLNKSKSRKVLRLKYLLLIPILLSMLVYSSCETDQEPIVSKEKSMDELVLMLETKLAEVKSGLHKEEMLQLMERLTEEMHTEDERKRYIAQYLYAYLLSKKENLLNINKEEELILDESKEIDELSFRIISKPPIFPGCEDAKDQKECFNLKLHKYVARNFDVSLSKGLGLEPGKKKIYVQFKIDKNGEVVEANSRAPHKALETEAIRLVESLPKMQAAEKENGEKVTVTYMLPITFNIQ